MTDQLITQNSTVFSEEYLLEGEDFKTRIILIPFEFENSTDKNENFIPGVLIDNNPNNFWIEILAGRKEFSENGYDDSYFDDLNENQK